MSNSDKWISVKDRLPEPNVDVIVFEKYMSIKTIKIGHRLGYEEYDWVDDHLYPLDKVIFWMPLPKDPKDKF